MKMKRAHNKVVAVQRDAKERKCENTFRRTIYAILSSLSLWIQLVFAVLPVLKRTKCFWSKSRKVSKARHSEPGTMRGSSVRFLFFVFLFRSCGKVDLPEKNIISCLFVCWPWSCTSAPHAHHIPFTQRATNASAMTSPRLFVQFFLHFILFSSLRCILCLPLSLSLFFARPKSELTKLHMTFHE